jgi:hypothetical protein
MRKGLIMVAILFTAYGCGNDDNKKGASSDTTMTQNGTGNPMGTDTTSGNGAGTPGSSAGTSTTGTGDGTTGTSGTSTGSSATHTDSMAKSGSKDSSRH